MKKAILFISQVFYSSILLACTCAGPATFCEAIVDSDGIYIQNPIVNGIISKKESDGMEVKIQILLSGELMEETIFIVNGSSAACQHSTEIFSEDESYLFVLSEFADNYYLSNCYVSYVKMENGILQGPIAPGVETLPFEDLATLIPCGAGLNLIPSNVSISSLNKLSVFPNPTSSEVRFRNLNEVILGNEIELEMFDVLGHRIKVLKKENGILAGEDWIINVSELAVGIYFFKITSSDQQEVFKIVKE